MSKDCLIEQIVNERRQAVLGFIARYESRPYVTDGDVLQALEDEFRPITVGSKEAKLEPRQILCG